MSYRFTPRPCSRPRKGGGSPPPDMRPHPAPGCLDVALVEPRGNGVVAGRAGPHDLIYDGSDICGKPPRIPLHSRRAELGSLGEVWVPWALSLLLGGLQSGLGFASHPPV
jgi:hypothetical protein